MVQGQPLAVSPGDREAFEQTLQRAPVLWSDSESAHPRAKALTRAVAWCQLLPGFLCGPSWHRAPPSLPQPPLPSLPFCPGRRGFVLPTQTGSSRGREARGQTLQLCSWGEEWPPLCGGELEAELVTQDGGLQTGPARPLSLPSALAPGGG